MKKTLNPKIYYKGLKKCNRCSIYQPIKHYYKNKTTLDGLYHFCKDCVSSSNKWIYRKYKSTDEERIKQKIARDKYKSKLKELGVTRIRELKK
jgi:hypothetical protein